MFKGLITDAKSAAASFVDTYLARASVAVPFLIALGLATAALGLELAERFGSRNALWMLAGGFCVIGLVASFVVTMKKQETEAAEEEQRNEGGIGEMASTAATAATQAATQLPTALLGALLQSPSDLYPHSRNAPARPKYAPGAAARPGRLAVLRRGNGRVRRPTGRCGGAWA